MACSQTVKGTCCVFSSICIILIIGTAFTWGNINVYYVSYVRLYNPDFTLMDGFFMVPIAQFFNQYTTSICGYFEKYTGPKLFNVTAIICLISTHILLYFFTNYWIIMIAMALFGVGWGFGYFTMMKQCWKYFPERKGTITGIIISCIGISTFLSTSLADFMINPNGEPLVDGYFPKEIAEKTHQFLLVMIIILSSLGFISCCLMFPYVEINSSSASAIDGGGEEKPYVQKERVKEVLRSPQFYLLGIITNGITFFSFLASNTNRTFGSLNNIDESLLQTLSKVYALLNGLTRFVWGYIYDKVNYKIVYYIVIINHMTCAFTYYFAGQNGIAFFVINSFVALSFAGHAALFNPVLVHVFGIKNSIILLGLYNYVVGIFGLINPFLCKFYIKDSTDFFVIYTISGCFVLSAFIACIFLKKEKYVYTWKSQRDQKEQDEEKTESPEDNISSAPLVRDSSANEETSNA